MKILVVCQYYFPEKFKINDICNQLVKNGHKVHVLTGLPNYPKGIISPEYRWGRKRSEIINEVRIFRTFEIGRKRNLLGLALNYISFMLSASIKALFLEKDYDIIFIYQLSPVTMALPGIIMKKRIKIPLYLYCCDIWPESIKNLLSTEKNYIYKISLIFSKYIYSKCDMIAVTSKPFLKYFNELHKIPKGKIVYLPQHAEDSGFEGNKFKNNLNVNFVFTGNIGIAQDIDCIICAAERIKNKYNFKIHLVGDGSYLLQSKRIVENKNMADIIIFHGQHPLEKMQEFYNLADACLLTLKCDNLIGMTMPSKLQGYMAAGKPVIAAINGAAREVIEESKCGICVNAGDSEGLAMAMESFIKNPSKYKDCGKNGFNYFKVKFTKEIFINELTKGLTKLVEDRNNV